jgi:hypothetical protein
MYAEGKLPEPDQVDGIGPLWTPAKIERWAEREWGGRRGVGGRGAGVDEYETHEALSARSGRPLAGCSAAAAGTP